MPRAFHRSYRTVRWLLVPFAWIPVPGVASAVVEESWQALVVAHAGWTALAGIGLIAVAIAARHVSRHHANRADVAANELPMHPASPSTFAAPGVASDASDEARGNSKPFVSAQPEPVAAVGRDIEPVIAVEPKDAVRKRSTPASGNEVFLALHHVDLSIDVLHRHLLREPRPMPAVWLMLLDLARTHGREQKFCELALEFHQRFNVCTPNWDRFPPGRDEPGLEAYPRLVKEITLSWGTHECRRLIDRLLFDNRGGSRRGFTLNAYNDLIALKRACDAVLDTIELDLAEEAKLRSAFATAAKQMDASEAAPDAMPVASPLVRDLECELDADLRTATEPRSALEREHPALVGMLMREWSNAALVGRLCEILARGGHGDAALSEDSAEELDFLRQVAERSAANDDARRSTTTAA